MCETSQEEMMRYLSLPKDGPWVAVRETFASSDEEARRLLRERIQRAQVWFFDLDDNHAYSPAKTIAKNATGTSYLSPTYLLWCMTTAWALFREGKNAECRTWEKYITTFLQDTDVRRRIREQWSPEMVQQSLYPGVQDFCSEVSHAWRLYVTRNIEEVAEAFAEALDFEKYVAEAGAKERIVEHFVREHPGFDSYGVEGDSECDGMMAEVLRFYNKDVIAICSMDKPREPVRMFDVSVSKNRQGLVDILQSQI